MLKFQENQIKNIWLYRVSVRFSTGTGAIPVATHGESCKLSSSRKVAVPLASTNSLCRSFLHRLEYKELPTDVVGEDGRPAWEAASFSTSTARLSAPCSIAPHRLGAAKMWKREGRPSHRKEFFIAVRVQSGSGRTCSFFCCGIAG